MRTITIVSLSLENFKGVTSATHMWDGKSVEVCGDNGTGKSTLADAAAWCLFGKDMRGRKDYCIVPIGADGEGLHELTTRVEMVLRVEDDNSACITYRLARSFVEKYSISADGEKRLSGHTTRCEVDGSPRKVSEYDEVISDIVGSNATYRCVTDPLYFCSIMPQDERRALLLKIAGGERSNEDIASGVPEWEELLAIAGKRTLEQFRRDMVSSRNKITKELKRKDAALEQTRRLMPAEKDWDAMEYRMGVLHKRQDEIDEQLADSERRAKAEQDELLRRRQLILGKKLRLQSLEVDEVRKANEEYERARTDHARLNGTCHALESEINDLQADIANNSKQAGQEEKIAEECEREADQLRAQWIEKNSSVYDGGVLCPVCGQPLPKEMIDKAMDVWNTVKADALDEIARKGKAKAEEAELHKNRAILLHKLEQKRAAEVASARARLDEARKEYARNMIPQRRAPQVTDEINDLVAEISKDEEELQSQKSTVIIDSALIEERKNITTESEFISSQLAMRDVIRHYQEEIENIQKSMRELATEKAQCMRMLDVLVEFQREKVRQVEDKVNSMFEGITFRLYEYTLDGASNAVCVPLIGGVPFEAANSAARMNAGLEAITMIGRSMGVMAPIWIDNAESNMHVRHTVAQEILLRVTDDRVLTTRAME